ncbi:RdgB/HAM1 family non-canonical purine NTP pyrophosphatase [Corynebacterium sp. zg912]|uniref:dITP/XTP pyrophosphatase n=1 Tax=Corynebacterium wankanglinii TaxID=2735136 RepID=A0A7H0K9Q3_9CORY|nr:MULTISPECIES: RdgB/HAM1 family non-canonical purine NTP pyrophosphatase [Corynebacterium]MBA1837915.1 RdgB/HAM1 family non-canonical purine NTP pyrophosphatase [Corynebacterium wankanglinii]MCR5929312.1 RdgB/HAM1 family non-canonical purine NTP pyrophosphatase [Corynebacterium sp. zg912]QNP94019.1 RdgB/HAM1 family non-canonical purine NTP pyrophosphatase [Corynebacterium wankanglinii]
MVKILVASRNQGKVRELEQVLRELNIEGVELVSLHDAPPYPDPVEDGLTFAENALLKARAGAKATGLPCVADDSGLTVKALNGMPGILSARWSGTHGDDQANNDLLLAQMADINDRRAAFVSCCVLATPGGEEYTAEGRWEGELLREPRGENGFGYDPLFQPADADGRSSAELSAEEKNARSHRGKALRALAPHLAALQ